MNIENKELIEKTTTVLDKIMNFFKKVVNKQTITDKGVLHHAGELTEGAEVYNDDDMSEPASTDCYTTASSSKIAVQGGKVQKITPAQPADDSAADGDDTGEASDNLKSSKKPSDIQNKLQSVKAKLHAQNALLNEAKEALEEANIRLKKTREEVKNEIHSNFTPDGSKRSNKAKTEAAPFFAPQTTLAQNAVRKAVAK